MEEREENEGNLLFGGEKRDFFISRGKIRDFFSTFEEKTRRKFSPRVEEER